MICRANTKMNSQFTHLNLIHANAYAAIDAKTSGMIVASRAIAIEFTM